MIVLLCLACQFAYELACDSQDGGRRVDRWIALTGPISRPVLRLSAGASNQAVSSFSRQALAHQPYPHSLEWLLEELAANPFAPCELTEQDWARFGLARREIQARVLAVALAADFSEGRFSRNFLLEFSRGFEADSWVFTEIVRAYQHKPSLLPLLPYRVRRGEQPLGSEAFRSVIAQIERGSEPPLDELKAGEQEDLLYWLASHHPEQLRSCYESRRGRLKALTGILLLRQGDISSRPWLRNLAEHELALLTSFNLEESLLADLADQLPETRLAHGFRDYAQIQGQTWAGAGPEPSQDHPRRRQSLRLAGQTEKRWRHWLERYPEHPAAGTAAYRLVRCLEWQGKRKQAFKLLLRQLHGPEGPAHESLRERFLWMLDVGLTAGEISALERAHQDSPARQLLRYALAVRAARQHRYQRALNLTRELSLERCYLAIMGRRWTGPGSRSLDECLMDQRFSWQAMLGRNRRTWAERWSAEDGWRLGSLYLIEDRRSLLERSDRLVDSLALEPSGRPDAALIRRHYQQACPDAVAQELLRKLAPSQAVILWRAQLLQRLKQGSAHEARALVPLPGFPKAARESWYASQVEYLTRCMEQRYPGGELCDDALMVCYQLTGDRSFLREIRLFYPGSDQALLLPTIGSDLESE